MNRITPEPALRVDFGDARGVARSAGPAGHLRFRGPRLLSGLEEFARHDGHGWETPHGTFTRLDVAGPLRVRFEGTPPSRSRIHGPFSHFSCVGGVAYAERQVFALFHSESLDWYCIDDGRHWPAFSVLAVPTARFRVRSAASPAARASR